MPLCVEALEFLYSSILPEMDQIACKRFESKCGENSGTKRGKKRAGGFYTGSGRGGGWG